MKYFNPSVETWNFNVEYVQGIWPEDCSYCKSAKPKQ